MAIEMFINLKKYVLLKKHGFPLPILVWEPKVKNKCSLLVRSVRKGPSAKSCLLPTKWKEVQFRIGPTTVGPSPRLDVFL